MALDHHRLRKNPRGVRFFVPGTAAQQGSKIPGKRNDGTVFLRESSKGLPAWRKLVSAKARIIVGPGWIPLDGPLELSLTLVMSKPKSMPKTIVTYPTSPPDLDKLVRAIGDSLTVAKIIVDDGRITDLHVRERYVGHATGPAEPTGEPGVHIRISELGAAW